MRIKKVLHNEYIRASNYWIRNFTNQRCPQIDITRDNPPPEWLKNEFTNLELMKEPLENYQFKFENVVVVSNGYKFKEKLNILKGLPNNKVAIFAVNGVLRDWDLSLNRSINLYVVNNPFPECVSFLPINHSYFPRCVASSRTYSEFVRKYNGVIYLYAPVPQVEYSGPTRGFYSRLDDSRSPICAALSLAYKGGAKRILSFCCDDSFERERSGSMKLNNNLYSYPAQKDAHEIIDAYFYWLSRAERKIQIADHSSGFLYNNAKYITEHEVLEFFEL